MKYRCFGKKTAVFYLAALFSLSAVFMAYSADRLETVGGLYWSDTTKEEDEDMDEGTVARWDEVEEAYQYEVRLYCEDEYGTTRTVCTEKTKKPRYNFRSKMTREGDYYFKVRALAKGHSYSDGLWSDYSDTYYFNGTASAAADDGPQASIVVDSGWKQDEVGWWYRMDNGSYPSNGWFQDPADQNWYYLDERGYMKTGWIEDNGIRYYCDPAGTPAGAMARGDRMVDGVLCHFDESGALMSETGY